ncbi:hypothetical protein FQR65_LT15770 [Abscondita terminalis]|nr:hypothetical protein FQR65_LT15770 [Abscondita terminalis]
MFKSDLQAVADSVILTAWPTPVQVLGTPYDMAEGSQISADTPVLTDQRATSGQYLKGERLQLLCRPISLDRLFVDGNCGKHDFVVNEEKKVITEMCSLTAARIKILDGKRKIKDYVSIRKVDGKSNPLSMVTNENEVLARIIWRPEYRPVSKKIY